MCGEGRASQFFWVAVIAVGYLFTPQYARTGGLSEDVVRRIDVGKSSKKTTKKKPAKVAS